MVWYPSVDDVVYANFAVFALGDDKHPHDLVRSREAIQSVLSQVRLVEEKGVIYQAAFLMKGLLALHAFAGGNHRTAHLVACLFLRENGRRMRVERLEDAYAFIGDLERKTIEQLQEWIRHG